jgi:uncharacterized protein YdhG (YjbR/CyaY superfamily)
VAGPESIDEYLDSVPETMRGSLETLRRQIRAEVPDAVETVSYGVPMFKLGGRPLVSLGAASKHLSLYVMSPAVVEAHAADLQSFKPRQGLRPVHAGPTDPGGAREEARPGPDRRARLDLAGPRFDRRSARV